MTSKGLISVAKSLQHEMEYGNHDGMTHNHYKAAVEAVARLAGLLMLSEYARPERNQGPAIVEGNGVES